MTAYYNEIDPYAAQWLRNLIKAGHIAPGDIDERSIEDVRPDDLRGYTQCHFFAGIGVWSYSLRLAGWPDDRPVWTGSCPCPPFSSAGKGSECPSCGGKSCLSHPVVTAGWICLDCGDEWRGDDRHLLPEFIRLIGECGPAVTFGEQVASRDGRLWLYTLRSVLERMGHAIGAADTCSAGSGAPHIRQRLRFVAERMDHPASSRHFGSVARAKSDPWDKARLRMPDSGRANGRMGDSQQQGLEGQRSGHQTAFGYRQGTVRPTSETGKSGGVADASKLGQIGRGASEAGFEPATVKRSARLRAASEGEPATGPTNGFWRDADWLFCRDGKWRPVEPGTFPLAHGATARVGRLRAYGNAVDAQATKHFIEAYIETVDERFRLTARDGLGVFA